MSRRNKLPRVSSVLAVTSAAAVLAVAAVAANWQSAPLAQGNQQAPGKTPQIERKTQAAEQVAGQVQQKGPYSKEAGGPAPSQILAGRTLHKPPALSGEGDVARRSALAFIEWAGGSTLEEREDARQVIAGARENKQIAGVLCQEAFSAQKIDHSRALIVLSILGEMRSPVGEECLRRFVNLPFPQEGTKTTEGEIVEQTALATLQAKAIDGLAYMSTASGDEEVLRQVQKHPSIIVRAEAINAYLWNHRNSPAEARRKVSQYVRKGEEIYLDRIRREEGEHAESFNRKLEAYLKAHPEVMPPAPERDASQRQREKKEPPSRRITSPPKF
jgi:hypothetical protein